jgi:hypothetical protein
MKSGPTHSEIAAKLVVEGCLGMIAGTVAGRMPITPMVVTELERSDLGLPQGGKTLFYPLSESGVFFDMHQSTGTVFFADHDFDRALPAIEGALKRSYPNARQIKTGPHPRKKAFLFRAYEIDLGKGRIALLEIDAPESSAKRRKFVARVIAQARKN